MFYLLKGIKIVVHESNLEYREIKTIYGEAVWGCFGRLDYAEIWKDFYNKDITLEELNLKL